MNSIKIISDGKSLEFKQRVGEDKEWKAATYYKLEQNSNCSLENDCKDLLERICEVYVA